MKSQNFLSINFSNILAAATVRRSRNAAIAASVSLLAFGMPATSFAATAVNLGTAGYYGILSKSGISSTGTTHVMANMGVSPIASTAITGFGLKRTAPTYSTSSLVTG